MKLQNLYWSPEDVRTEYSQLTEEGRDLTSVERDFDWLMSLDDDALMEYQVVFDELLDKTINLPLRNDCPWVEPGNLASILACRPNRVERKFRSLTDSELFDKLHGAWLGRIAGCMLGKPVEGWRSGRFWGFLGEQDLLPLRDYMSCAVSDDLAQRFEVKSERGWINLVDHAIEDDDTNYTVSGLQILKKWGRDFEPSHVAEFWMDNIPLLHTWTAERIAYRNFAIRIAPPESAWYRNPYREWIGAQIRADFYGYAALGNPELAAEWAWRDSSVSHVKNGIYGEMWVAAMIAVSAFLDDPREIIRAGLEQIPVHCRLARSINEMLAWFEEAIEFEEAIVRIHDRWDETTGHHWCHTISNAKIVAMGLLWGEGKLGKSICRAVQAAFDTDCNGATVGSIIGMMLGAKAIPDKWISPLGGKLATGIAGYQIVEIEELARESVEIFKTVNA